MPILQRERKGAAGREALTPPIKVPKLDPPQRLDKFLIENFPNTSRQFWKGKLSEIVRINQKKVSKGLLLKGGENIALLEPLPKKNPTLPPNPKIPLKILYQDPHLLAVEKPAGIPCHPLREKENSTIVNAVLARFPKQAKVGDSWKEAGLIYRLDNETSGVLLFARTSEALEKFRHLSQGEEMKKTYLALVEGTPPRKGTIDLPISHHPKNKRKMQTNPKGRKANTEYRVLRSDPETSLIEAIIHKGSRHQIRIHFAAIGHPILGDRLYGFPLARHYLHAHQIEFFHPYLKKNIVITSTPPPEFK